MKLVKLGLRLALASADGKVYPWRAGDGVAVRELTG